MITLPFRRSSTVLAWCGDEACEVKSKEDTAATSRCIDTQAHVDAVCEIDHQNLSFNAGLFSHDIADNNFFTLYQNLAYIPADDSIIAFFIYSSQTHLLFLLLPRCHMQSVKH